MSKKIHIKAYNKLSHTLCGVISKNTITFGTYKLQDKYDYLDRSRLCKECKKWIPIFLLSQLDEPKRWGVRRSIKYGTTKL